jgi:hypothetical protein
MEGLGNGVSDTLEENTQSLQILGCYQSRHRPDVSHNALKHVRPFQNCPGFASTFLSHLYRRPRTAFIATSRKVFQKNIEKI